MSGDHPVFPLGRLILLLPTSVLPWNLLTIRRGSPTVCSIPWTNTFRIRLVSLKPDQVDYKRHTSVRPRLWSAVLYCIAEAHCRCLSIGISRSCELDPATFWIQSRLHLGTLPLRNRCPDSMAVPAAQVLWGVLRCYLRDRKRPWVFGDCRESVFGW